MAKSDKLSPLCNELYSRVISSTISQMPMLLLHAIHSNVKRNILRAHLGIHLKIIVKTWWERRNWVRLSDFWDFASFGLSFTTGFEFVYTPGYVKKDCDVHGGTRGFIIKDWRAKKSDPLYTKSYRRMSQRGLSCALLLYLVLLLPDFWVTAKDNRTCPLPGYFVLSQLTKGMAAYSSS